MVFQFAGDVARAVITQKFWSSLRFYPSFCNGPVHGSFYVISLHSLAQLPMNNEAAKVVQNCAQVIPTPANYVEIGKVRLPHFMHECSLVLKFIAGCK